MIIDGHSHACGQFLTAKSILKILDKNGVDKIVLVPGELNSTSEYSLPNIAKIFPNHNVVKITNALTKFVMSISNKVKDIPQGNEYVYGLKKQTNDRVIQFLWLTTEIDNIKEYLNDKHIAWDFKGIKLHQCWESFSIDSSFFNEAATWAENHDMPLFIHLYSDRDAYKIIDYKIKHPKLKLIIAHLFGLELFIKNSYKDENLYFDISTLPVISNLRLMKAIDFIGVQNILFATDTPYGGKNNIANNIKRINNLELPKESKNFILGLNIKRLLKI